MKFTSGLFLGSLAVLSTAWSSVDAEPLHFQMLSRDEKAEIDSKLQQDRRRLYGPRLGDLYRNNDGEVYGGVGSVHFWMNPEIQPMRTHAPTNMPSTSTAPSETPRYVSVYVLLSLSVSSEGFEGAVTTHHSLY